MNDDISERSQAYFASGLYCAESVLLALAERQGIQSDLIPRIATGFCSGVARTGGMCGAVSGAIMGIGLAAGRSSPAENIEVAYGRIRQFIERFEQRHGSINCRQLIGCDLATEEGQRTFAENNLIEKCRQYVGDAAGMAQPPTAP